MPKGYKNISPEDGAQTQFSSTYQPPNRGRKPKVFSQLSKEWQERGIERATPQAVAEAFEYVLALHALDVREIAGDAKDETNDMPMVVRLAAKELLGRRSLEILREMLDRAHGKAKQSVEHSGPNGGAINMAFDVSRLTDKEAADLLALMEKAKNE